MKRICKHAAFETAGTLGLSAGESALVHMWTLDSAQVVGVAAKASNRNFSYAAMSLMVLVVKMARDVVTIFSSFVELFDHIENTIIICISNARFVLRIELRV